MESTPETQKTPPEGGEWCYICGLRVVDELAWVDYDHERMWFCPQHKPLGIRTYEDGTAILEYPTVATKVLRSPVATPYE